MARDFEDHCWKDVIDPDTLQIYQAYHRRIYVGDNPAVLAIDLYNKAYLGGSRPVRVDIRLIATSNSESLTCRKNTGIAKVLFDGFRGDLEQFAVGCSGSLRILSFKGWCWLFFTPKGWHSLAQGNALGTRRATKPPALKGRQRYDPSIVVPLQGGAVGRWRFSRLAKLSKGVGWESETSKLIGRSSSLAPSNSSSRLDNVRLRR